jgi:hypothetical protein
LPYLIASVVLVGILCSFDLVLSLGIIRRLREQHRAIDGLTRADPAEATVGVGRLVDDFEATSTRRNVMSRKASGIRLVGFFSPGCRPCEDQIPAFIDYSEQFAGRTLAVVVGTASEAVEYVARLETIGDVIVEAQSGPLSTAFHVSSFPALCLIDGDGMVLGNGFTMATLRNLARV